jgi:hypothetical protein
VGEALLFGAVAVVDSVFQPFCDVHLILRL